LALLHLIKLHLAATRLEPALTVLQRQDGLVANIATQQLKCIEGGHTKGRCYHDGSRPWKGGCAAQARTVLCTMPQSLVPYLLVALEQDGKTQGKDGLNDAIEC
jgi:hypothetical protein